MTKQRRPYPGLRSRRVREMNREQYARARSLAEHREDARLGLYEAATGLLLCLDPSPYLPALYAAITRAKRLRRAQ